MIEAKKNYADSLTEPEAAEQLAIRLGRRSRDNI